MKKKIITLLVMGTLVFSLMACQKKEEPAKEDTATQTDDAKTESTGTETEEADSTDTIDSTTFPNITVDYAKKELSFEATVNGTYFTEGTRHGIVAADGSNGEKSVLRAVPKALDYEAALTALGLKGDTAVGLDDMKSSPADNIRNTGDPLEVFVKWDGQDEIPFNEILKADKDFDWNVVVTGNKEVQTSTGTGCILCLDSCAAGISANNIPVGSATSDIVFNGNADVLPADGTTVTVIVRAK
ncbi:MAG: YdjY domain-containing protein [Lachnospiraceae bacterium]|jgi:hypothetical protein|nr:YdjY domain-containing protein [Lachnospiraceae bacterium]